MNPKKIGKLIKDKRIEKGLTQSELAEQLNITDKAISKWESGNGLPDISIIKSLSEKLGISTEELLEGEEKIDNKITYKASYVNAKSKKTENVEKILRASIISVICFTFISTFVTLFSFGIKKYDVTTSKDSDIKYNEVMNEADKYLKIIETKDSKVYSDQSKEKILSYLKDAKNSVKKIKKDSTFKTKTVYNKYQLTKYYINLHEDCGDFLEKIVKTYGQLRREYDIEYMTDASVSGSYDRYLSEAVSNSYFLLDMQTPEFRYDFDSNSYFSEAYVLRGRKTVIPSTFDTEYLYLETVKFVVERGDFND